MNKVILMGRLTRDPDIRMVVGATLIARYTLAVDRYTKQNDNEQTADFISCVAFGKAAEFAQKYLHQGIKVLVTGRMQTGSYTNRDGKKVYTTDVIVEGHEFVESKNAILNNRSNKQVSSDGFMNMSVDDEGLPFN